MDVSTAVLREGIKIGIRRQAGAMVNENLNRLYALNCPQIISGDDLYIFALSECWQDAQSLVETSIPIKERKNFEHFLRSIVYFTGADRSAYALSSLAIRNYKKPINSKLKTRQLAAASQLIVMQREKKYKKITESMLRYVDSKKLEYPDKRIATIKALSKLLPKYNGREANLIVCGMLLYATEPNIETIAIPKGKSKPIDWASKNKIDWNSCTPWLVGRQVIEKIAKRLHITVQQASVLWLRTYIEKSTKEDISFWTTEYINFLDTLLSDIDQKVLFSKMVVIILDEVGRWIEEEMGLN